jgi:hypothetical protein
VVSLEKEEECPCHCGTDNQHIGRRRRRAKRLKEKRREKEGEKGNPSTNDIEELTASAEHGEVLVYHLMGGVSHSEDAFSAVLHEGNEENDGEEDVLPPIRHMPRLEPFLTHVHNFKVRRIEHWLVHAHVKTVVLRRLFRRLDVVCLNELRVLVISAGKYELII